MSLKGALLLPTAALLVVAIALVGVLLLLAEPAGQEHRQCLDDRMHCASLPEAGSSPGRQRVLHHSRNPLRSHHLHVRRSDGTLRGQVTPADALHFFEHCGYSLRSG